MQEEQAVGFQPIYEGYQPWFARLFALYLFVVLVVIVVRLANFVWNLRKLRNLQRHEEPGSSSFNSLWTDCYAKEPLHTAIAVPGRTAEFVEIGRESCRERG